MDKKLFQNIDTYRQWAWDMFQKHHNIPVVAETLGLEPIYECYDYLRDEDGEMVVDEHGNAIDIDEEGNVIPPDTAETVKLADWLKELTFPIVVVYWIEKTYDEHGRIDFCYCAHVSIKDFDVTPE